MTSTADPPARSRPAPNPQKAGLRSRILPAREALAPDARAAASAAIARRVLHMIEYTPDPIDSVALYASFGHEVATHELIRTLLARRLTVALPYIVHRPRMLEMRVIDRFPEGLRRGDLGILEPEPLRHPCLLGPDELDLVILPGVAFDRRGNRLGYGAGFYDRWLAGDHRCATIGLAFAMQLVDAVPIDPWDRRVDAVVTESEKISVPRP
jgi:5-formyltetrahydrofolate cyclo-ligase